MSHKAKTILFIMFDQLRFDYLSCYGHPHLHTPNIDNLASKGVRFTSCYVQSPICGSFRMSYYMGDYWLGEKDLFHEPSVKVPMIIYDPSAKSNGTRGKVCDELVES